MLRNACLLEKFGYGTAENEPGQVCCVIRAHNPWFGIVTVPGTRNADANAPAARTVNAGQLLRATTAAKPGTEQKQK